MFCLTHSDLTDKYAWRTVAGDVKDSLHGSCVGWKGAVEGLEIMQVMKPLLCMGCAWELEIAWGVHGTRADAGQIPPTCRSNWVSREKKQTNRSGPRALHEQKKVSRGIRVMRLGRSRPIQLGLTLGLVGSAGQIWALGLGLEVRPKAKMG